MQPRIGIIGGGVYGHTMLKAYTAAKRMGQVDAVVLAEIKEDVLREQTERFRIKGYTDYREMLRRESLDAVAIVTPDHLHREIALQVASQGVHMLVQKPLDTTVDGAQEIIRAAHENNVLLFVDFHKRFDPGHIQLQQDIQQGKLGRIQYGYVWMEDKITVPSVWFKTWAQHSSPAWFLGIHFYDLLYWLVQTMPTTVYATGVKDKLTGMGIDTYDSIQAKIAFANGTHFSVDSSWILPDSFPSIVNQGIRVVGSQGIWEVDSQDRGIFYALEDDKGAVVPNYYGNLERVHPLFGTIPTGYVIDSMLFFLQLVAKLRSGVSLAELQGSYPCGTEALVSTAICEAVHRSVETGEMIQLQGD